MHYSTTAGGPHSEADALDQREPRAPTRPELMGIRMLAALVFCFALAALFGSLFLWGEGFIFAFPPGVDYALPAADILIHAPAGIITAAGLWRLRRSGYVASRFVAGFYLYASVEIFASLIQEGPPYPAAILTPQLVAVAVAMLLLAWLRRVRRVFR